MYEPMNDAVSELSERELADIAALADGTLPADRRTEVEARVATSPAMQELLERQRQSLALTQTLGTVEPPLTLQADVAALRRKRERTRGRWLAPRLAAVGVVAAVAIVAALVLTGGPGSPTVAEAAGFATEPPTEAAPPSTGGAELAVDVQGVAFPDLAQAFGWKALGVRKGRVHGRNAVVVYYGKSGRRIAYVIVSGAGLSRPAGGQTTTVSGTSYQTLRLEDRLAVTWQRGGHTCVLLGDAARAELVALASWLQT